MRVLYSLARIDLMDEDPEQKGVEVARCWVLGVLLGGAPALDRSVKENTFHRRF